MEASKLKQVLDQHKLWLETSGVQGHRADLTDANLRDANLRDANLRGANLFNAILSGANLTHANLLGANLLGADLRGADLTGANLSGAILTGADLTVAILTGADLEYANLTGAILPDISWIKAGCLVQLNKNMYGFYLKKENKLVNFVQDSFGFFIQNNVAEETFDMLLGDRIIRNIPYWVKYTGLKQVS